MGRPLRSQYIAAIDQGTTSTRCIILDRLGTIQSISQKDHQQRYPKPGWVEHDALEILDNTQHVLRDSVEKASINPDDLAGLGITNQRETTVAWSRSSGKPLHNALVWQDTRTSKICDQLTQKGGKDRFRESTGLPISTYFSGPKVKWLLEHVKEIRQAERDGDLLVGTMDSWLVTWAILEAMEEDSGLPLTSLKADGGMVVNEFLMQFQADILNVPVVRPTIIETTSLSAAYAAGSALGFWDYLDVLREMWKEEKGWRPEMVDDQRKQLLSAWHKAVERSFGWAS